MESQPNAHSEEGELQFQAVVREAKGVKAHEVCVSFTGPASWSFAQFLRQLLSSLGLTSARYRPFYYSVSHRRTAHTGWLPLRSLAQLFELTTPRIRLVRSRPKPRKRPQAETSTLVPYTGGTQVTAQTLDLQSLLALNQALMAQQCWLMSCMLQASGCVFNSH